MRKKRGWRDFAAAPGLLAHFLVPALGSTRPGFRSTAVIEGATPLLGNLRGSPLPKGWRWDLMPGLGASLSSVVLYLKRLVNFS